MAGSLATAHLRVKGAVWAQLQAITAAREAIMHRTWGLAPLAFCPVQAREGS